MENHINNPTSEVGSVPTPAFSEDQWRTIMELQNRNFLEMCKAMQASVRPQNQVVLPKFNPDLTEADATQWCATASIIMDEQQIDGSALIMMLSSCMQGSASAWLAQICYPGINWEQFKELFIQRFEIKETPAAMFLNLLNSRPPHNECPAVYASRMVTSLTTKWRNMNAEEIAVSTVLAHMANFDNRLQRMVFSSNVQTRSQLQMELRAFTFDKKRSAGSTDGNSGYCKRAKIVCHLCKKPGLKMAECKLKRSGSENKQHRDLQNVTCYRCGQLGHLANRCTNNAAKYGAVTEKKCNQCFVAEPKGVMTHQGEIFPIRFDSGAECSLMRSSVADKFDGKLINNIVIIRGIGDAGISSKLQKLSKCIINGNIVEILFHVIQISISQMIL